MVGIMDVFDSADISIGTVIKNPEILKFIPDHLKTKNMCKHAVKKCTRKYTWKYLKQDVLKSCVLPISPNQDFSILFVNRIYIANIGPVFTENYTYKLDIVQNLY